MTIRLHEITHAFRPLPREAKVAVAVLFGWMLLLSVGVTIALYHQHQEGEKHAKEAQEAKHTAKIACVRSRVFGKPFLDHVERVEARLHTGALEGTVEWPVGSHRQEQVLKFFRTTIPSKC